MLTLLVAIWVCVFCFWYWLQRRRLMHLASKIPGPPGYPLIGNALTLWGKPEDVFKRLHSISLEYSRMVALWIGPQLHVALFDPKDVEVVLRSRTSEKADEYRYLRPWLGDSILLSTGMKFKQNKKLIMPSFHISNLKLFIPIFNDHAVSMVERLQKELEKEEFNISPYLSKTTMDVLLENREAVSLVNLVEFFSQTLPLLTFTIFSFLETMLGISKETLGKEVLNYAKAVEMLGRLIHMRVYKFWLRPEIIFRFSRTKREQAKHLNVVHSLTDRVIQQRKKKQECQKQEQIIEDHQRKVFLDNLLEAKDENGIGLSDADIKAEVMTMMFAGQDTTSATLGFALSLLGIYQKVQEKVMREMDEIFGESGRPMTYEDIQSMRYLEQVIQETWRLYPPIPLIARKPKEDIALENCIIPANSTVGIMIMAIHRNPAYFENPDHFNPDNFLPENIKSRHPYSFIPFSGGSRTCIGPKYATLLVKVILATLLRSYRVYSKRRQRDFVLAGQTVLKRRDGYLISIKPREKSSRITAAA